MVRREEAELIKSRALSMLEASREQLLKGNHDLAAFLAEQAVQLFIKYRILEITGEMPRTHVIRELLGVLGEVAGKAGLVRAFVRRNRSLLIRLEEAYLASRYLFRRYEREETRELVNFAEKVIEFVRDIQV